MAAYDVHVPKVMLPATQTICLKYSQTKFVILCRDWYLIPMAAYDVHMPNMMLPVTQTICLKYSHTNFQVNVGISS